MWRRRKSVAEMFNQGHESGEELPVCECAGSPQLIQ